MASLQKTYSGDLTTAIAGKLYEAIKDADDKNQLEKTNASKDVKQAAVKAKKEDPESVPVRDMDLRETIVNFFTPIDGKLIKAQATYSAISSKVTSLAGGVADTQKLLINQNQILEDKFDQILNVIGTKNALEEKLKAESQYKQLEMNLEGALDLSGTFAYGKTTGRGNLGIVGSLLQGIVGNRMTSRLIRNLYKKLPKGLRARARLLRKNVKPLGRVTRFAVNPVRVAVRAAVNAALKSFTSSIFGKKGIKAVRAVARVFGKGSLVDVAGGITRSTGKIAGKSIGQQFRARFAKTGFGKFIGDIPNYVKLLRSYGTLNADKITNKLIDAFANRAQRLRMGAYYDDVGRIIDKELYQKSLIETNKLAGEKILKNIGRKSIQKTVKKGVKKKASKVAVDLTDEFLTKKGLLAAFNNPMIRRRLQKKLGREGMERLMIKAGAGGGKTFVPGLGTLYAFGEGLGRISPLFGGSDPLGMLLSFGSAIPYGGWGVVMADILRDIDRQAFDAHILPNLFNLSEENINSFFTQALELDNQFERGTPNISSNMLGGVDSISEILGVTKAFGEATGFGAEVGGLIGEAGLGSYPTGASNYSFDVSGNLGGGGDIQSTKNKEAELRKKETFKPECSIDSDCPEGQICVDGNCVSPDKEEKPSAGETIMKFLGKTAETIGDGVQYVDEKLDFVRQFTGGERGDGKFTLGTFFGKEFSVPNIFSNKGGEGGASTIEFHGQQGRDRSGEPGVDFSFQDYKNNYNLFPGYVLETGLLYGKGYGNVVVVRSVDPSNGKKFDALYAHFPDGGIAVKPGQQVGAGDLLGSVGFVSVDTPGVPQLQPNNAGNMSGWHTSVDFFEPDSPTRYSNADKIINLITGASGSTPDGLLQRLKPSTNSGDTSTLNNIEANSNLASTMTNLVENGSSERLMTQRQASSRLPIVIINNQTVNTSQNLISFGGTQKEGNFFEAYNLARHTV